jgi:hypothetical protein
VVEAVDVAVGVVLLHRYGSLAGAYGQRGDLQGFEAWQLDVPEGVDQLVHVEGGGFAHAFGQVGLVAAAFLEAGG